MHNDALDWNETAVKQAMDECDNVPYLMIGSLGLGAVALAFTNYFVAGALTLGGVALSQKKQNNACARAEFAIKHNGSAVAARGNELKEYTESFGKNAAAEQLLHAAQRGIPLNRDGWNLLEDHYGDRLDDLLEQSQTEALGHRWFEPELVPPNSNTATSKPTSVASSTPNEPTPIADLMHCFRLQNTLVWGGQGSGKTSLTRAIAADKLAHTQKVIVLNPHGSAGTWQGMKLIGAGKNYAAVEEFMRFYISSIKKRYQIFEQSGISEDEFLEQLLRAGLVETVICEEASSWSVNVDQELLHEFTRTGLTESRKVGLPLLIVTHDPSLSFMGLKKGERLRDAGMAIAELEPGVPDRGTGFLKATGKGKLQLPGQKDALSFVFEPPQKTTAPTLEQFAQEFSTSDQTPQSNSPVAVIGRIKQHDKTIQQQLEDSYRLNAADEFTQIQEVQPTSEPLKIAFELDDVLPELRPIVEYSIKQNGFIKAIDVKRNVKEFKAVSTEEIRNHFIGLVNQGCGVSQGDGDFLKYSAFEGVIGCDAITG